MQQHGSTKASSSASSGGLPELVNAYSEPIAWKDNVRGRHFSMVTLGNGKPVKFVIGLRYLTHPKFLELLEKAEWEFGFDQTGMLVITCEASELQRILLRKHT